MYNQDIISATTSERIADFASLYVCNGSYGNKIAPCLNKLNLMFRKGKSEVDIKKAYISALKQSPNVDSLNYCVVLFAHKLEDVLKEKR